MRSPLPPQRPPTQVHRLEDYVPASYVLPGIAKAQVRLPR